MLLIISLIIVGFIYISRIHKKYANIFYIGAAVIIAVFLEFSANAFVCKE